MATLYGVARASARAVIGSLFENGYSATQSLRLLQIEGLGYRRQTFLADWREITGVKKLERVTRFIPKNKRPTEGLMTPKASPVGGEYTYRFETEMYNPVTGETSKLNFGVTSDRRLTVDEAEQETMNAIEEGESAPGLIYQRGSLISVLRR